MVKLKSDDCCFLSGKKFLYSYVLEKTHPNLNWLYDEDIFIDGKEVEVYKIDYRKDKRFNGIRKGTVIGIFAEDI